MFLKNLDLISGINCIYYKGQKTHGSRFGGILTILAYITCMFFACYFSIDTIYKKNPTSYFFQKFIKDAGFLYLNSSMFHYVELLDPDDNVVMDKNSWMIFGTETYVDFFLNEFSLDKESHWNYGPCVEEDFSEFKDIIEDPQHLKAWCVKGYWDAEKQIYLSNKDKGYIPPYVAHGTGSKELKNLGYGLYIAKCINTPYRSNCRPMNEINEEQKKLLRIKVSIVDNNFDVTIYQKPEVPYFLDIKSHLTGETFTFNNLNFNPVEILTNDGFVFNNKIPKSSYVLDFNSKTPYSKEKTVLISGWYFLITNLCQTYSRTYPKIQDALANVGGALKAILFIAEFINFIFNKYTIILDVQYECEKLGLNYSFFSKKKFQSSHFDLKIDNGNKKYNNPFLKNNGSSSISELDKNKNTSKIPLSSSINSNPNNMENRFKNSNYKNQIDNNVSRNSSQSIKISNSEMINEKAPYYFENPSGNKNISATNTPKEQKKKKKNKSIKLCDYIKSIFIEKIKDRDTNIRLMHKFWINKISEENIVQMDLKLYKLSPKHIKYSEDMHINNLLDESL